MADSAFQVEVVAVDERLWSGQATFVIARTTEGELGVLADHEALFGQLIDSGAVAIDPVDGERLAAAIRGGFISVTGDKVTVLADAATWVERGDEAQVREDLEAAVEGTPAQADALGLQAALDYLGAK